MPISVIAKEGKDKSKSRARGPRDTVYKDVLKGGKFKRDPKTRARKPMMGGGMTMMPRAMYKKGGKSFPDLSGDGKVTMKDILMGRGVIKRPKKKGGIARGCGAVMSDRRKKTKMY